MADHNANLGSTSAQEVVVATGRGPHVYRTYPVQAGQDELAAGLVVSLDAAGEAVPFDTAQELTADGNNSDTEFGFSLGGPVVPGSVSVSDGVETFADDGFGSLVGDAGGSGSVNYQTGAVLATFNTAPADTEDIVVCGYKPAIRGVLNRAVAAGAVTCEAIVMGQVNRKQLAVGASEPTDAQLLALDRNLIWPL